MIRPVRPLALAATALALLTGCGVGGHVAVQAQGVAAPAAPGPSAPPEIGDGEDAPFQVVGGDITVAPGVTATPEPDGRVYADEPQCPAPPPGFETGTRELHGAVREIGARYDHASPQQGSTGPHFTGIVVCEPGNFFTVFRVPGSAAFDNGIRKTARRHDVTVHLRDTKYSLADLERTRAEVESRRDALARKGAHLAHTAPQLRGGAYLEVGIEGRKAPARRLLAEGEPEPEPGGGGLDVTKLLPPSG